KTEAERAADSLASSYASINGQLHQQIALYGETGEAARLRYEIEAGALKGLAPDLQAVALEQAEWLDWLNEMAVVEQAWADSSAEQASRMIDAWNKAGDEMSVFAEQAGRNMQDEFADFLFDPFDKGLKGMAEGFANIDRKSTRLNSSHVKISYAVFCLKKKKKVMYNDTATE